MSTWYEPKSFKMSNMSSCWKQWKTMPKLSKLVWWKGKSSFSNQWKWIENPRPPILISLLVNTVYLIKWCPKSMKIIHPWNAGIPNPDPWKLILSCKRHEIGWMMNSSLHQSKPKSCPNQWFPKWNGMSMIEKNAWVKPIKQLQGSIWNVWNWFHSYE